MIGESFQGVRKFARPIDRSMAQVLSVYHEFCHDSTRIIYFLFILSGVASENQPGVF